jgi:acylphosphatase
VQRVGYRAKVLSLARELGLTGFVQNRPDGQVLLIAEGDIEDLENFASALKIKNALIDVQNIESEFTNASGTYLSFRKITGPEELGERLDDGIEILKELVIGVREIAANVNNLTVITTKGFENLNEKMDGMLDKQDQMLDKQDTTITEIQGMRGDILCHLDQMFENKEDSLAKPKELTSASQEKGTG